VNWRWIFCKELKVSIFIALSLIPRHLLSKIAKKNQEIYSEKPQEMLFREAIPFTAWLSF